MFRYILDFVASVHTVTRCRLHKIFCGLQENPYLQYFCGYSGFDDSKPPFDPSSMVHFRKRITPEILAEINEMIIQEAQPNDDDNDNDENGGTMIVDATGRISLE